MELLNYYKTRYERAKTEKYKGKILLNACANLPNGEREIFVAWAKDLPTKQKAEKQKAEPTATHYFRIHQESYDFLKSINYPMNSEVNKLIIERANELKRNNATKL